LLPSPPASGRVKADAPVGREWTPEEVAKLALAAQLTAETGRPAAAAGFAGTEGKVTVTDPPDDAEQVGPDTEFVALHNQLADALAEGHDAVAAEVGLLSRS
jgi:hypothetical protein